MKSFLLKYKKVIIISLAVLVTLGLVAFLTVGNDKVLGFSNPNFWKVSSNVLSPLSSSWSVSIPSASFTTGTFTSVTTNALTATSATIGTLNVSVAGSVLTDFKVYNAGRTATTTLSTVTSSFSGAVGINTTSAAYTLDVNGSMIARGTAIVNNLNFNNASIANLAYSGTAVTLVAGENLVAGDIVYVSTTGQLWKADANVVTTTPADGVALATISAGSSGLILIQGVYRNDTLYNFTTGSLVYVSTDSGTATTTQPSATDDLIQIIGKAISADIFLFSPNLLFLNHS